MKHSDYFDNVASEWDNFMRHDPAKLRRILDFLMLFPGSRVMDVGCGTGVFTEFMLLNFAGPLRILCVDISEKMIGIAKNKFAGNDCVTCLQVDATNLSLQEEILDRIICYSCIPHIRDKKSALMSFRRLLAPSGIIEIAHSDGWENINSIHAQLEAPVKYDYLEGAPEMKKLMELAGFIEVETVDETDLYIVRGRKG